MPPWLRMLAGQFWMLSMMWSKVSSGILQHWGWLFNLRRCRRHGVAAPAAPGAMPLCVFQRLLYAAIGLLPDCSALRYRSRSVAVGVDRRLYRPGLWCCRPLRPDVAYPHLAPECSFHRSEMPSSACRLAGWRRCCRCSWQPAFKNQSGVEFGTVDGQLALMLIFARWLLFAPAQSFNGNKRARQAMV